MSWMIAELAMANAISYPGGRRAQFGSVPKNGLATARYEIRIPLASWQR